MVQSVCITLIDSNTILTSGFDQYLINAGTGNTGVTGNFTITLPAITTDGMNYELIRIDSNVVRGVTIQGTGSNVIVQNLNATGTTQVTGSVYLTSQSTLRFISYDDKWYTVQNSPLTPPMLIPLNSGASIAGGTVYLRYGSTTTSSSEAGAGILVPRNGFISNFTGLLTVAPAGPSGATASNRSFRIRVNGVDTTATFTISGLNTTGSSNVIVPVRAGQYITVIQRTDTGTGNPASSFVMASFTIA